MITRSIAYLAWTFVTAFVLTGCNGKWKGDEWVQSTDSAKQTVLLAIPNAPYQREQHDALKGYFEKSEALLQLFDEEPKAIQGFNEYLSKQDIDSVCERTLLSADAWREAMSHCQKNNYFLCAESVRQYPEGVRKLRDVLSPDNQKRFDESPSCKAVIAELNGA